MQPQGHLQTLVRMLDYGQQPQAACDAPRWKINPDFTIDVEAHRLLLSAACELFVIHTTLNATDANFVLDQVAWSSRKLDQLYLNIDSGARHSRDLFRIHQLKEPPLAEG